MRGVRIDPERAEVRLLLRRVPLRGARVLEIGCGDGRLTRRFAGVTREVLGIDPDKEQIARARSLNPAWLRGRVRFRAGTAQEITFRSRFDVALLSWSL